MQLAVWDTCFKAYWYLLQHVWTYVGQFALLFATVLALRFTLGSIFAAGGGGSGLVSVIVAGLTVLLGLIAFASICVRCQRAILLDETPRLLDLFRFGFRDLRYLAIWLAAIAALVTPVALVTPFLMPLGSSHWPILVITLAWAAFVGPVFALAFPAAAIDQSQALRSAMRLSRGYRLQLLGVLIVVHLPLVAMALPLALLSGILGHTALRIVQALLQFASNLALAAATSVAYQVIAGRSPPDIADVFD